MLAHAYVITDLAAISNRLGCPIIHPLVDQAVDLHIHSATPDIQSRTDAFGAAAAVAMVAFAMGRRVRKNVAVFGSVQITGPLGG